MGRKKKRNSPKPEQAPREQESRAAWGKVVALAVALVVIAVVVHFLLNLDRTAARRGIAEQTNTTQADSQQSPSTAKSTDAAEAPVDLQKLKGRWLRTDGEKEIDIQEVKADGTLDAAYFNPSPIRVSDAKASAEDGTAKVFVELQDVGYPGCTYDLTYDADQDRLKGTYFQAAQQQQYAVEFVRQQ